MITAIFRLVNHVLIQQDKSANYIHITIADGLSTAYHEYRKAISSMTCWESLSIVVSFAGKVQGLPAMELISDIPWNIP